MKTIRKTWTPDDDKRLLLAYAMFENSKSGYAGKIKDWWVKVAAEVGSDVKWSAAKARWFRIQGKLNKDGIDSALVESKDDWVAIKVCASMLRMYPSTIAGWTKRKLNPIERKAGLDSNGSATLFVSYEEVSKEAKRKRMGIFSDLPVSKPVVQVKTTDTEILLRIEKLLERILLAWG